MGLKDDLEGEVRKVFRVAWTEREGRGVPSDTSVTLGNDAVKVDAVVLYADIADSTQMVEKLTASISAEVYKTFLHCAAKIIRFGNGEVTAYDGDRVMGVYVGNTKRTQAMMTAMRLKWAVNNIVQKEFNDMYPHRSHAIRHVVGIDASELFVAKTGVRGANDLVWVGRAANVAAKLASCDHQYSTYLTSSVYDYAHESAKVFQGRNMWFPSGLMTPDGRAVYRSNEDWPIV